MPGSSCGISGAVAAATASGWPRRPLQVGTARAAPAARVRSRRRTVAGVTAGWSAGQMTRGRPAAATAAAPPSRSSPAQRLDSMPRSGSGLIAVTSAGRARASGGSS